MDECRPIPRGASLNCSKLSGGFCVARLRDSSAGKFRSPRTKASSGYGRTNTQTLAVLWDDGVARTAHPHMTFKDKPTFETFC